MQAVNGFAHLRRIGGIVDPDDLIRPLGAVFFVEFIEHLGAIPFAVGETVENGEVLAFGQRTEKGNDVFWGTIEADIDGRFFECQRFANEIDAEGGGKTARILVPEDIVTDVEIAEQTIELWNPRRHPFLFHGIHTSFSNHSEACAMTRM